LVFRSHFKLFSNTAEEEVLAALQQGTGGQDAWLLVNRLPHELHDSGLLVALQQAAASH
jgi:hypothetical protein